MEAIAASITAPESIRPFILSYLDDQPFGTCVVYSSTDYGSGNPPVTAADLNFGLPLTVTGPNGTKTVDASNLVLSAAGNYLNPGTYTVSSPGGTDIGPFVASFVIPVPPAWTNGPGSGSPNEIRTITRSQGATFTWAVGASPAMVEIDGVSATDPASNKGASFVCRAAREAGSFTVPPSVLLALPASSNVSLQFKALVPPTPFTATGLDTGFVASIRDNLVSAGLSMK